MKLSGEAASGKQVVVFPDDKRQVIIQKMILVVDGQPDRVIDLTQPIEEIKKKVVYSIVCFQKYLISLWNFGFRNLS